MASHMKMQIEVEVLDPDICKDCPKFDIDINRHVFYAEDKVYAVKTSFRCPDLYFCEKFKEKLESAKQTTPVIDDRKE